jgi:hypothetical protein
MPTSISTRVIASRALFAWIVVIEPSWPVFIACSMSITSSPRTSPTMIRDGRMRSAFLTRSRAATSPVTLEVGRARLEPHHVRVSERELGRDPRS